ncbi:MAG: hypothetical protein PUB24_02050 [Lachnospiraceae bacterium]|nr:hypothetical protein [Lachnospiraceae bacterium]
MKKKITSIMLTLALAGVCVLSAGQTVQAGTYTYTDGGSYTAGTATQDDPSTSTADIDVQAQTTGGGDIVYSVKIDWGAMKFEYDYGSKWDPATHKYIAGNTGKAGGGWNTTNYLDGTNNKITVTNDSNFPINADFSYENTTQFNATASASAVAGMFDTSNSDLKNAVDANTTNTQGLTAPTLALNTSKANLVAGDVYYYQGTDDGVYTGNMFFSLIGKPDRGIALTTMQSVGSIHVTISPATATTRLTK